METTKSEFFPYYPPGLSIVQIQIIHRHGPRTPLNYRLPQLYPFNWPFCATNNQYHSHNGIQLVNCGDETLLFTFPRKSDITEGKSSDCFLGQLTDLGKNVMEQLGKSFRNRYIDHLGFNPRDDGIHLRSTNYSRTIESLQSLLKGLFPNRVAPFPIHVRDEYLEDMYGSTQCHKYSHILKEYGKRFAHETAEEVRNIKRRLPHIFEITDLYGRLPSIYGIYDTLISRQAHGLSLPKGVTGQIIKQLENLSYREWFQIFSESTEAIKFAVGRFIRELDANLYRRDRQLCIYSAHDSTIAPIVAALSEGKLENNENFPPFASSIVLELLENRGKEDERFVRVLYNDKPMILPQCMASENHFQEDPSFCTLKAFSAAIGKFIPLNYLQECQKQQ